MNKHCEYCGEEISSYKEKFGQASFYRCYNHTPLRYVSSIEALQKYCPNLKPVQFIKPIKKK